MTKGECEDRINKITGEKVVTRHNNIRTKTGERLDVIILNKSLEFLWMVGR